MDAEEKGLFVRAIELATGITAVVTLVVLSSVAGTSAYIAFQPSSLAAQAISAADTPLSTTPTGTTAAACQQEIATAAARGTPDTQFSITDQSSLQFQDNCVAAVLSPSAGSLGPNNPASYMCVGKSATVNVAGTGVVTETAVPDPAIPAGTCTAVACGAPGAGGASSCAAANSITNLNGTTLQNTLAESQTTLSSDSGISSFTLNADGSISNVSGDTSAFQSAAGDQGLTGNSVGLDQTAGSGGSLSNTASADTNTIGETQAVGAQPAETTSDLSSPAQSGSAEANAGSAQSETASVSPDSGAQSANASASQNAGVADNTASQSSGASGNASAGSSPSTQPSAATVSQTNAVSGNGPQATSPTLNGGTQSTNLLNSDGTVNAQPMTNQSTELSQGTGGNSETWISKVGTEVTNIETDVTNTVRGWFGLGPINSTPLLQSGPVDTTGIRG